MRESRLIYFVMSVLAGTGFIACAEAGATGPEYDAALAPDQGFDTTMGIEQPPEPDATALEDATGPVRRAELPACSAGVLEQLDEELIAPPEPGSRQWQPLSPSSRQALRDAVGALLDGDGAAALEGAAAAGYGVCRGADEADEDLILWRPTEVGLGRAWMIWRDSGAARPLIVGAPHPWYEIYTLTQARKLFTALGTRAVVVSGTHRCASKGASTCTGKSEVCTGQLEAFRDSDMAHTVESSFQAFHEALLAEFPGDVVVSLHGMGDDGVSVSNGTGGPVEPGDAAAALTGALIQALPDQKVTSCNHGTAAPRDTRLCGTTNTQGRLVNGARNACVLSARQASGRFVHLEQSLAVRKRFDDVVAAFEAAFPDAMAQR